MKAFSVDIVGLGNKVHEYEFKVDEQFFKHYGTELIEKGRLETAIKLDKRETMIEAHFNISGTVQLICDRSLEAFDHPVNVDKMVVFKYGHQEVELSDEIILITHETPQIDLGQFIYEFVALEVPMKKLHPRFQNEATEEGDTIIYRSELSKDEQSETDPRWDALKKLK